MPEEIPGDRPPEAAAEAQAHPVAAEAAPKREDGDVRQEGPGIATAALVGVGVAILEPELIPGMLIGVGATLAPKMLPALGGMLRPLVKGVVKTGYKAVVGVREMVAEAGEQIEDIVAEARAEHEATAAFTSGEAPVPREEAVRAARRTRTRPHPQPQGA